MNRVILTGRLTGEPQLKYTNSNKPVCSFSVAVNKRINGENNADFINCVAWNTTAEFISKYFKKGQAIGLTGRLQNRSYEDSNGQKRYVIEVVIEEVEFIGSKQENKENTNNNENVDKDFYQDNLYLDDDMLF